MTEGLDPAALDRHITGDGDPGPVPDERLSLDDPFTEPPTLLDFSKPVELSELVSWLLDVSMHYTNAAELIVNGDDATGFRRLLQTLAATSHPLSRVAATFLPELFEGFDIEAVEVVTSEPTPDELQHQDETDCPDPVRCPAHRWVVDS